MQIAEFTNAEFLNQIMQEYNPKGEVQVNHVTPFSLNNSASILSVLTAGRTDQPIGHFGLEVEYLKNGVPSTKKMVMKIKPHGIAIVEMINHLALACGEPLATIYPGFKVMTGFKNTHIRELEIHKKIQPELQQEIYGLYADHDKNVYIVLMEYLEDVHLLNSVMEPKKWTDELIKQSLIQLAQFHATNLGKETALDRNYWEDSPSKEYMINLKPLWQALLQNAHSKFPDLYTHENCTLLQTAIHNLSHYWSELAEMPKTLIHNDANPRNACFKYKESKPQLCLYDWELATFHVPQYDVVEFLCFILDEEKYSQRLNYLEFYRQELNRITGKFENVNYFTKGYALAAQDFGLHRLGMYMMAHSVSPYPFLPRVVKSYFDTLKQVKEYLR